MTPDEVIKKLEQLNVGITRRTLLNYEARGFIKEPIRGGKGRGKGRTTEYNNDVWLFAYIAYRLMRDEGILQKYITIVIEFCYRNSGWGYLINSNELDKKTAINLELLLLKYLIAGLSGIPYGGKIEILRDNHGIFQDINHRVFQDVKICLEDNMPIQHLGTQNHDALIIVSKPEEFINIDKFYKDFTDSFYQDFANKGSNAIVAYMWNDNIKEWEPKGLYILSDRNMVKMGVDGKYVFYLDAIRPE